MSSSLTMVLRLVFLLVCLHGSLSGPLVYLGDSASVERKSDGFLPKISPTLAPQPFLPSLAPSPLAPFMNNTTPKLSGLCTLNFTAAENAMKTTSIDCWTVFAPLLANVICCPQLQATLVILMGQSSKESGTLALNKTHARHCLSDIEHILAGQGAGDNIKEICSVHSSNLTEASCPVKDVNEFENMVDSSKLLAACEKIDPVKECCDQICQSAIFEAATKIASNASNPVRIGMSHLSDQSTMVDDCRNIVLRWLASKLDPSRATNILRGLTNCNVNSVCPLVFPNMKYVASSCGDGVSIYSGCCDAMGSYVAHLQKQSLITNLQALDCATSLGLKLQKSNISRDVYSLCHISLKDFSLQVGNQVSGCLLPSLPSDAIFDNQSGISFTCDLNDNIPAPWPSSSELQASTCRKTIKIPALPAAASSQNGLYNEDLKYSLLFASTVILALAVVL